ncbi:hypothetical protein C8Q78DRAFT_1081214 [Trametes maxima]|nr:hypothetical protein C8Q78DRAFT_1081214 [Trametes maxima]
MLNTLASSSSAISHPAFFVEYEIVYSMFVYKDTPKDPLLYVGDTIRIFNPCHHHHSVGFDGVVTRIAQYQHTYAVLAIRLCEFPDNEVMMAARYHTLGGFMGLCTRAIAHVLWLTGYLAPDSPYVPVIPDALNPIDEVLQDTRLITAIPSTLRVGHFVRK